MRRLTKGDRVIALRNPYVAEGTPGIIRLDNHSETPYFVLFEGDVMPLWMKECQVRADYPADEPSSKPTRTLNVGDMVRIKSREWYEANKNERGVVEAPFNFVPSMSQFCGETFEIAEITSNTLLHIPMYRLKGVELWWFSEEMFDLDDSAGESAFNKVCQVCKSILGGNSKSIIKGNLPLIKTNKLLTNIKLD